MSNKKLRAVSRTIVVVVVVIILIIAAVGGYLALVSSNTTSSSSLSTSSSSSSLSSSISSTSSVSQSGSSSTSSSSLSSSATSSSTGSTSVSTLPKIQQIQVDDVYWSGSGENQLNLFDYPNWQTYSVYQPLVFNNGTSEYASNAVQFLPGLATNWTVSSDQSTYTFNLRHTNFTDGNPFNAYSVWAQMYGYYYLAANASNWWVGYVLYNMSNVNFGPATIATLTQSGVVNPTPAVISMMENTSWPIYVTGPYTVVFHLKIPFQYFLNTLLQLDGLIIDVQYLLQHGGWGAPGAMNTYFNLNPMPGTGPYKVVEVVNNAFVKFQQNPNYWGENMTAAERQANPYADPGHVNTIVMYVKQDDVARYSDLSSGSAVIAGILQQDWPLIQQNPQKYGQLVLPSWSQLMAGIGMNTLKWPTNVTAFRQAVQHAINHTDIAQKVFFGQLTPMVGPEFPAWQQFYDQGNYSVPSYNLTLAKQLLQQAVGNQTVPALQFAVQAGCTFCADTAQVIQGDLAQIGININIEVLSVSSFGPPLMIGYQPREADAKTAQQAANFVWMGGLTYAPSFITPADNWAYFTNCNSPFNNFAGYCNPIVQQASEVWFNGSSTAQIQQAVTAAQAQLQIDQPYIWVGALKLWFGSGSLAWDKSVVSNFLGEPSWSGTDSTPILNTIQFVNGQ